MSACGGVVFSPARGPAGAAGPEGPEGPAGPAGSGVPGSPDGTWLNLDGVEGTAAAPFDLADWTSASVTGPNVAGSVAVPVALKANGTGNALRMSPTSNAVGALMRPLDLADGDSVCARLCMRTFGTAATANTSAVQLIVAAGGGADQKYVGAGFSNSSNAWTSTVFLSAFRSSGSNSLVVTNQVPSSGATVPGYVINAFDVRLTRSGVGLLQYARINDGAWLPLGAAQTSDYPNQVGTYVGFRVSAGAGVVVDVDVVAFAHVLSGELP